MDLKLSRYTVPTSVINPEDQPAFQKRILYSAVSNAAVVITDQVFHMLNNGSYERIEAEIRVELENARILVPAENNEFANVLAENKVPDRLLSMVLHATSQCQLGCRCKKQAQHKSMDTAIAARVADYLDRQLEHDRFDAWHITWDGGDALTELPLVKEISQHNIRLSAKYDKPCTVSMITNGADLHLDTFRTLFYDCLVKHFHIVVGGSMNTELNRRSFSNIEHILAEVQFQPWDGIIFEIKVNVDKDNHHEVSGLVDKFGTNNFQNRIIFKFCSEASYCEEERRYRYSYTPSEFAELEIEYLMYAAKNGFPVNFLPSRALTSCPAVNENFMTVDVQGNMFGCYALPYTDHEQHNANMIGNLFSEPSLFRTDLKFRQWYDELDTHRGSCYDCNLFPVCGGGCRLKWSEGADGCPSFRYNFEDRLILNYLTQKGAFNS
ncbi:SPASM domain-containing protein [Chitinophaga oryziterrae]|uniref:SPASM domain-containing protein n=1 Tax=Chitinophaga oryziterrae TaxID=1031224 RepID=A0A6N8JFN6_9BACT|nr:SPASM domain-containing protein [Chitinophaga oryziterrae]MVT43311.1 SPASM domain-containing protein [Chitinophaga oryziterrae]